MFNRTHVRINNPSFHRIQLDIFIFFDYNAGSIERTPQLTPVVQSQQFSNFCAATCNFCEFNNSEQISKRSVFFSKVSFAKKVDVSTHFDKPCVGMCFRGIIVKYPSDFSGFDITIVSYERNWHETC